MHSQAKRLYRLALRPVLMLLGLFSAGAWAGGPGVGEPARWQLNMTEGASQISQDVYDLHMLVLWICIVVGVGVFAVMFYSVFAYSRKRHQEPATFHENTRLEIAWTVIPFLILIVMAIPATTTLIDIYDTEDADLDILVTGYQWRWNYEYLTGEGENVRFFSSLDTPRDEIMNRDPKGDNYLLEVDNPMVIPVDRKVRLLVTANDVIHSWWVPALSIKRDAIPGFINEAWTRVEEPGVYRGMCAELCGRDHAYMPVVVEALEQDEFDSWLADRQAEAAELQELAQQTFDMDELMERGRTVYQRNCVACHGDEGQGGVGPALADNPVATGELNENLDVVVNGVSGTAMQAFGDQLNEVELAAVITYQRNAFGNNMGDQLQPVDIHNFKQDQ